MVIENELIERLRTARRIAALTGAGVSQESGLRTFRDAQTGLWAQYKPHELASPEAFQRDPKLVWDCHAWRRELLAGIAPNVPGFLAQAFPARFAGVGALWTGLYSYAWFLGFAIAGIVFGATRLQLDTHASTPFSSASAPRYAPHGQQGR